MWSFDFFTSAQISMNDLGLFWVLERMPPHGVPLNQKIEEKGIGRQQQKGHQIHTHNNCVTLLNMNSHVFLARLLDWLIFLGADLF
jgi:hypothetical protein